VYGHADLRDAQIAKGLTLDEARRIASNIAVDANGQSLAWGPVTIASEFP